MKLQTIITVNRDRIPKEPYYKVIRYLAFPFVYILQFTPITPNMVSFGCHLFTILAAFLFIYNSFWLNIVALLALHCAVLCDFIDGTLARVKHKLSMFIAHYIDRIFHEVTTAAIFIGIGFGTGHIYLGFAAALALVSNSYLFQLKNWLLMRYGNENVTEHNFDETFVESKQQSWALKAFVAPMLYIRFILLIFVLVNRLDILIWIYGIFLPIRLICYFGFLYLNFRRRDRK